MSWLFGRRSDDEEEEDDDDDDEDYSEEDEYTSSDDDEEEETDQQDVVVDKEQAKNDDPQQSMSNGHANEGQSSMTEASPATESSSSLMDKTEPSQAEAKEEATEEEAAEPPVEIEQAGKNETTKIAPEPTTVSNNDGKTVEEEEEESVTEETKPETVVEDTPPPKEEESAQNLVAKEETVETRQKEEEKRVEKVEESLASNPVDEDVKEEQQQAIGKEDEEEEEEEVEEVTSTHEKRSLLVLAAEHDRVDILKAILADDSEDRDTLLNSSIPPLHISIAYGSTNAVQSLLRMGADPSVRPDIQKIKQDAETEGEEQLVDIPHMGRFDQLSAWELAFGKAGEEEETKKKKSGGWFGGGDKKSNSIDIAPSKLEGIRHAFTAEGLRCIGSDEVDRLKQLIDSGMPSTIDIGGKNLYDWAVEMGALQCEELLRPAEAHRSAKEEDSATNEASQQNEQQQQATPATTGSGSSAVLDRSKPGTESLSQLNNRIDELENLSKALSTCLDNLAEEVSVCHGLLLMGGGATALASHVRSLKTLKENKTAELDRLDEAYENSQDELAYWVKESGEAGREIAELMTPAIIPTAAETEHTTFDGSPEEEQAHRQQLKAQAALLENKIRKLRASIADLSEESTRDLEEVESRGLSGGIKLVRSLRDEIREVEFALNETRSAEALCRAKIALIQSTMSQGKKQSAPAKPSCGNGEVNPVTVAPTGRQETAAIGEILKPPTQTSTPTPTKDPSQEPQEREDVASSDSTDPVPPASATSEPSRTPSETVSSGQSSAIALKKKGSPGYFTVDLWKILLRIIGLGSSPRPSTPYQTYQSSASNVMIV